MVPSSKFFDTLQNIYPGHSEICFSTCGAVFLNENFAEHALSVPPNLQIFWNLTSKNVPDRQQCVKFRKLLEIAKSFHPTVQSTGELFSHLRSTRVTVLNIIIILIILRILSLLFSSRLLDGPPGIGLQHLPSAGTAYGGPSFSYDICR